MVADLCLVGAPDDVARKLQALAALGIDHVTLLPRGHAEGGRPRIETVRAVGEHVIPRFR